MVQGVRRKRSSPRQAARKANAERAVKATKSNEALNAPSEFEAEALPGLEPFVEAELERLAEVSQCRAEEGSVRFSFAGEPSALKVLRTAVAVYACVYFAVPRPKALLGHEHLARLLREVKRVQESDTFSSFRFGAAGEGSGVLTRLGETLARETGLRFDPEAGELLVRLRRADRGAGWEALLRLTPRPLSARGWRVCNLEGGLNAGVAAAMLALAEVRAGDRLLNAMCGSGTLAIEQGLQGPTARLLACDLDPEALGCTRANAAAAGVAVEVLHADATRLPLGDGCFEVIVADPPWGDAVGTHGGNALLYPAFLLEAARVTVPGGRLVLLTHELRLFERTLQAQTAWEPVRSVRVFHGGHYPRIWLLKRRSTC